jgi:hypothetical protein
MITLEDIHVGYFVFECVGDITTNLGMVLPTSHMLKANMHTTWNFRYK